MLPTPDLPPISSSDPRDFTPEPEVIRDVYKALRDFRICRVICRARAQRRGLKPRAGAQAGKDP